MKDYNKADENCSSIDYIEKHKKALQLIEDTTTNADEYQKQVLYEILSSSAHVEYLQRHGLDGHTDRRTFKKVIPVITYEDLKPDITRIANGDTSPILCAKPITEFFASSGTSSGERKLLPTTAGDVEKGWFIRGTVIPAIINQYVPDLEKGKSMYFMFVKPEAKTPGGLVACAISTSRFKNKDFKESCRDDPYNNYTSPYETIICEDLFQSTYAQLLCGLYQNNQVLRAGTTFASGFLRMIMFLKEHWTLLCKDIRTGTIDTKIVNNSSVSEAVRKILNKPNPELADFIESECSRDSWRGIVLRLWPNTKYIDVIATGTMSQYIPALDYYTNGLPLVCTRYGYSEYSSPAVNLQPLCKPKEVSYTLIPSIAYYEFLPVLDDQTNDVVIANSISISDSLNDQGQQQHEPVDLVDVKLGKYYELLLTTDTGLYRYRVGDVLRVAGFKNKAPQFNFIGRRNVLLSIDVVKTDEWDLQNSVENSIKHLLPFKASLVDYTSYADLTTSPGHYVLYWELHHDGDNNSITSIPSSVFEDCCFTIEESLSTVYREYRALYKTIGPLELKIVEPGSFNKLMNYAISKGASVNQYKTPRCVKAAPILELLNSRVIARHFSRKSPIWIPRKIRSTK